MSEQLVQHAAWKARRQRLMAPRKIEILDKGEAQLVEVIRADIPVVPEPPKFRELRTVSAIIATLGGSVAISRVVFRTPSAVRRWRTDNIMPANTFFVIRDLLKRRGCIAPTELWGLDVSATDLATLPGECLTDEDIFFDDAPPKLSEIYHETCRFYSVTKDEFTSRRRDARFVRARHVATYLARCMTARSYPEIGRMMGGRDHTTAMHGDRKIAGMLPGDPQLRAEVDHIEKKVLERVALRATNVADIANAK
jgi:hypothetical protein